MVGVASECVALKYVTVKCEKQLKLTFQTFAFIGYAQGHIKNTKDPGTTSNKAAPPHLSMKNSSIFINGKTKCGNTN